MEPTRFAPEHDEKSGRSTSPQSASTYLMPADCVAKRRDRRSRHANDIRHKDLARVPGWAAQGQDRLPDQRDADHRDWKSVTSAPGA
jgi:hypothetical protein